MLSMSNAEMLIHAFITSRLDYCNALLGGCSARLINKLQMSKLQMMITAVNRYSSYPDQMVDHHLEMTSTTLNVSGDQGT